MCSGKMFAKISKILQEIRKCNKPFGGLTLLVAGDLLQLPAVIVAALSVADVVRYQVHNSIVWQKSVQALVLTEPARQKHDLQFYKLLQDVAEGSLPSPMSNFELPLIFATADIEKCEQFVYPDLENSEKPCPLDSAILTSTNLYVDKHNTHLQLRNPNKQQIFYSSDSWLMPDKTEIQLTEANFEFSSNCNKIGVPPHQLKLKIGDPVMILRNLDTSNELVNGTRGILVNVSPNKCLLVVKVTMQDQSTREFLIPRIDFLFKISGKVKQVRRRQFPVRFDHSQSPRPNSEKNLPRSSPATYTHLSGTALCSSK
jgi:ATP-dependent DNA helicase PIF1